MARTGKRTATSAKSARATVSTERQAQPSTSPSQKEIVRRSGRLRGQSVADAPSNPTVATAASTTAVASNEQSMLARARLRLGIPSSASVRSRSRSASLSRAETSLSRASFPPVVSPLRGLSPVRVSRGPRQEFTKEEQRLVEEGALYGYCVDPQRRVDFYKFVGAVACPERPYKTVRNHFNNKFGQSTAFLHKQEQFFLKQGELVFNDETVNLVRIALRQNLNLSVR